MSASVAFLAQGCHTSGVRLSSRGPCQMKRGLEAATGAPDSQAMRSDDAAKPASEQKDH